MDIDDAVTLALLEIGGGDEEADVEADRREQDGEGDKPGNQLAGQRIEGRRRGVVIEIQALTPRKFSGAALIQIRKSVRPEPAEVQRTTTDRCARTNQPISET